MIEQIKSFLMDHGWEFEQVDECTIATGFTSSLPDGREHSFPLYVMILRDMFEDLYVRLGIVPYVDRPKAGYAANLPSLITQINHDLPELKLAVDPDGDLELLLDMPASQVDQARFDAAIQSVADYAGLYYNEVASASVSGP